MILNEFGIIARNEWMKTPELRTNVELGDFIIMPNHVHGIIRILRRGESNSPHNEIDESNSDIYNSGECDSPLRGSSRTIGAIVRGYKSSVTKQLILLNIGCLVLKHNYYENIIQTEQSYQNISNYIINNPANWGKDKFSFNKITTFYFPTTTSTKSAVFKYLLAKICKLSESTVFTVRI